MGEYARQFTLDRFGVDIGDDEFERAPKPKKRVGCSCGKVFVTERSRDQHQKATGHIGGKGTPEKVKS